MQELVILLSSIAGAASAVAVKKFPRNRTKLQSIGTSAHIKNQINSLKIEKDILNKTIARLYENDSDVSNIQKDKLLLKYQHQLGIILAKLERLEEARRHPDLGPVGDGLITLMDQKLSQLDSRLYELSAKITQPPIQKDVKQSPTKKTQDTKFDVYSKEKSDPIKKMQDTFKFDKNTVSQALKKQMEITTLTTIPKKGTPYPFKNTEQVIPEPEIPVVKETKEKQEVPIVKVTKEKPTGVQEESTDDEDIEKIKAKILKELKSLSQAEVE